MLPEVIPVYLFIFFGYLFIFNLFIYLSSNFFIIIIRNFSCSGMFHVPGFIDDRRLNTVFAFLTQV